MVQVDFPGVNTVTKRLADGTRRVYYYHRASGVRLPDNPQAPEFAAAYAKLNAIPAKRAEGPGAGTFSRLIQEFKASPDFKQLSEQTRSAYARHMETIELGRKNDKGERSGGLGGAQVSSIERKHVLALRDRFADTPRTANYIVQVLRLLMTFAIDRGWRSDNPAARPKLLKTGDGHRPWEEAEIAAFRKAWAEGTRERVAFELLLNTGQRAGDVAAMVRQHYRAGTISVTQQKTSERLWIPAAQELVAVLDPWLESHKHMAMLPSERTGAVLTSSAFVHLMSDAIKGAGLGDGNTTHGLRYTAATMLHELGLDWEVIASVTGHQTVTMVRKYTSKKRNARLAIATLDAARAAKKERAENSE
ncbi:MAG: tyrosine-type recombinase/integrase [Alphaproteobacteria bacterium]